MILPFLSLLGKKRGERRPISEKEKNKKEHARFRINTGCMRGKKKRKKKRRALHEVILGGGKKGEKGVAEKRVEGAAHPFLFDRGRKKGKKKASRTSH